MQKVTPTRVRLSENRKALEITWTDGNICSYPLVLLRKRCPCATCQSEAKEKGDFYIPLFTADAMTLKNVRQQGNYAMQLEWADGHHTGIYDYGYLLDLCAEINAAAKGENAR